MQELQAQPRNQLYATMFGAALLAITAVLWDFAYNAGRMQGFLIGFLFALVVAAFALVSYTEVADRSVPKLKEPKRETEQYLAEPEPAVLTVPAIGRGTGKAVAYEEGEIRLDAPPTPKVMGPEAIFAQETAHILCGVCGDYFELDVQPARPLTVDCVGCDTELVIDGRKQEAEGSLMYCRHCHGEEHVPQAETLASYHCNECGKINQIRAVGAESVS